MDRGPQQNSKDDVYWKGLAELISTDVSGYSMTDDLAVVLSKSSTLTSLNLDHNTTRDSGMAALSANSTLRILSLRSNGITDLGMKVWLTNSTLTSLSIGLNRLSREGVETLTRSRMLRSLDLDACNQTTSQQEFCWGTPSLPRSGSVEIG